MITIEDNHDVEGMSLVVHYTDPAEGEQARVLMEALVIFGEKNAKYKDNWRRQGFRGPLYDLRRKVERMWDEFWHKEVREDEELDVDDGLDVINYAGILVRALREGDRDGKWW